VTRDSAGVATAVAYTIQVVDPNQTVTTVIAQDSRCRQTYQPCSQKYGWVDPTQSNIDTELTPGSAEPRFGFYQLTSAQNPDGTLNVRGPAQSRYFWLDQGPRDYRFLGAFDPSGDLSTFTEICPVAVLRDPGTGKRAAVPSLYRSAVDTGAHVALSDPVRLADVGTLGTLYVPMGSFGPNWVLDFAGVLVAVEDADGLDLPSGASKLALVGCWFGGQTLADQQRMTTQVGVDALAFQTDLVTVVPGDFRIGDLPNFWLVRGNELLETGRKRPV